MVRDQVHHFRFEILLEMKRQLEVVEVPHQYKVQQHIVVYIEAFPHQVRSPVDEHQVVQKHYVSIVYYLLLVPNLFECKLIEFNLLMYIYILPGTLISTLFATTNQKN